MSQPEQRQQRSMAEWVTFSIASSIVAGIVGLVVYSWVKVADRPPVLAILF